MGDLLRRARRAMLTVALALRTRSRGRGRRPVEKPLVSIVCDDPIFLARLARRTRYGRVEAVTTGPALGGSSNWSWTVVPDGARTSDLVRSAHGDLLMILDGDLTPLGPGWLAALVRVLTENPNAWSVSPVLVKAGRRVDGVAWEYRIGGLLAWPGSWLGSEDRVEVRWRDLPRAPVRVELSPGPMLVRRGELELTDDHPQGHWGDVGLAVAASIAGRPMLVDPSSIVLSPRRSPPASMSPRLLPDGARWLAGRWGPVVARELRLAALEADSADPARHHAALGGQVLDVRSAHTDHPYLDPSGRIPVAMFSPRTEAQAGYDGYELVLGFDEPSLNELSGRIAARTLLLESTPGDVVAPNLDQIRSVAREVVASPRIGWRIGPRTLEAVEHWGDTHLARHLAAAFKRVGFSSKVSPLPYWDDPAHQDVDIVVHLQGLRPYDPKPAHFNILWVISHPERVSPAGLDGYDLVLVASTWFAEELRRLTDVPVMPWLQSTNPEVFAAANSPRDIPLLFVGNSRGTQRPMVDWALERGLPLTIYGRDWEGRVPRGVVAGDHVPNHLVPALYGRARAVMNDHWPDMAVAGFVSNRAFDALACSTPVISDVVVGLESVLEAGVAMVSSAEELECIYRRLTDDPDARDRIGRAGRQVVLERHTTHVRVAELVDALTEMAAGSLRLASILERRLQREGPTST